MLTAGYRRYERHLVGVREARILLGVFSVPCQASDGTMVGESRAYALEFGPQLILTERFRKGYVEHSGSCRFTQLSEE